MREAEMADTTVRRYTSDESVQHDLFPGGAIQFVHTDNVTFAAWSFKAGTQVPSHVHPHEQITHCVSGSLVLTTPGAEIVLQAGETAVIPGGVEHAARADETASGVDVFFPVREDYRRLGGDQS
ncbi:cupin domain-containing protein [Actinoplanes couchii]|nr:cupin domain-containing protein [Actinoplanes couchii]MDR6315994.1 quercetin dioxygenase-like cupin family protein [Actinoplanes couchii]